MPGLLVPEEKGKAAVSLVSMIRNIQPRHLWKAFLRVLIALLSTAILGSLYLAWNPDALAAVLVNYPGVASFPEMGPMPPEPVISAPRGALPGGYVAFTGNANGSEFACGFLLELEDGQRVGVSSAHAAPVPPPGASLAFSTPGNALTIPLEGQIALGSIFQRNRFTMDYALWSVAEGVDTEHFLRPDPRGNGQPGERIVVYGRFADGKGGSKSWAGTVMLASEEATFIQMDEVFQTYGFSGCPVVSQHTGQVIGMAVAGTRKGPTRMGVHPIGSLVEKARKAIGKAGP